MHTHPVDLADFTIPFSYAHDAKVIDCYSQPIKAALDDALRQALGIAPEARLRCPSMGMGYNGLLDGETYRGAIRINGVVSATVSKRKVHHVSFSFVILGGDDAILGWSRDLDIRYKDKPDWVWFMGDYEEIEMTDAMRDIIKSLAPKKTRAKKTP